MKKKTEDKLKMQTIQKLNTIQIKQTTQNTAKQTYPGSVAFHDTRPGNETDLSYSDHKPTRCKQSQLQTDIIDTHTITSHDMTVQRVHVLNHALKL